ncbi:MAG TPA: glycosyltransferase family 9 protein [Stellaceae bacterium]|nr:glycosyltransferase family 9 protein [Stellaceae bacterium]
MDLLVYSGLELIGDGVMKLPFVRALKEAWPDARVTWLAGKGRTVYAHELAPLVADALDEIIEDAGIGSRAAELLHRPLAHRRFDVVIDTQRRVLTTLILRRLRSRVFVSGTARFLLSDRRPPRGYARPERLLDQLLDLIAVAGGAAVTPSFDLALGAPWREAALTALPPGSLYVGIAPGAGGAHKRWPRERFVALAEAQIRAGRTVAILLGPDERDWHAELHELLPHARFPLQDQRIDPAVVASPLYTIALGQRLAVAIANDSGAGHLLAASGCALVSLFGPTAAAKFAPAARRLKVVEAKRFGGEAMSAIPLEAVLGAVEQALEPILR